MASDHPRAGRSAGKALLRIGDTPVASVERYAGGEPFAEVVSEPGGLLPYAKKHIGELHFADLEAQVGLEAHPALFRWIRDAWFGDPARDSVALDAPDGTETTMRRIEMAHACLHEVVLPALDSGSRERRFLTLRIAPRGVRRARVPRRPAPDREERQFYAHNFSIEVDGLDCSGVRGMDAMTVHAELPDETGARKTVLVFPDIHLHVDADGADPFHEWFEDFVIGGNNDDDKERSGTITYLDPLLTEPVGVLLLHHLGIYRVADEPPAPSGQQRVRVDLYCERMELSPTGVAAENTAEVPPVKV
jgi:hypothetical protein